MDESKRVFCSLSVEGFYSRIFLPSLDERAHLYMHLTCIVEEIFLKFHRIAINSMDELIDPLIILPH